MLPALLVITSIFVACARGEPRASSIGYAGTSGSGGTPGSRVVADDACGIPALRAAGGSSRSRGKVVAFAELGGREVVVKRAGAPASSPTRGARPSVMARASCGARFEVMRCRSVLACFA